MNICTVTTRRRIPYAGVLAESFLERHPGGSFTAVVCDAAAGEAHGNGSGGQFLAPADLGVAQTDLSRMAMAWPASLMTRALVPVLLRRQIELSSGPVFFFADDTLILGSLEALLAPAERSGLVLSLRTRAAFPTDGRTPDEFSLLRAGVFESGFAGVGPSAKDCLDFWTRLIETESTGQNPWSVAERVQDLVAAHFCIELADHPGHAVSFWNVWGREITNDRAGWKVEGSRLAFFHFDGFSPQHAHLLSRSQGLRPRVLLSERADLRRLTEEYGRRLTDAGYEQAANNPYRFDFLPSGVKVDERIRRLYRNELAASSRGDKPAPPDPFNPAESDAFLAWLNSPDRDGPAPEVSRYLYALYEERGDLRAAFPGIARADAGRYLQWVTEYGASEAALPPELCPQKPAALPAEEGTVKEESLADEAGMSVDLPVLEDDGQADPHGAAPGRPFPFGVNILGYFRAELGVGEMGRLVLAALEQSGIPHATTAYSAFLSRQNHPYKQVGKEFAYDTNLFCVNADQLPSVVRDYGPGILEDRYNIALWWWEVDVFPPQMAASAHYLDEIWVGSEFVGRAIVAATDKLVRLLPIPVRRIEAAPLDRKASGIPDGFLFLASFDFLSVFERKNPMAVVQAYKRAFQPGEGAALLIKTINGEDHLLQLEELRVAAVDRPDIRIMDRVLPEEDKDRLLATCDCYVSLHRAEGYGLGMAEAMALGKPIIATNYSGNLAFLNETNSFLVGYTLVPVPPDAGPYPQGAVWAEPDIDQAAGFMRTVFARPEEARRLGAKARIDALSLHSPEVTGRFLQERLTEIRLMRGAPAAESGSRS